MKIVMLIASLQESATKIHGKYLSWLEIALSMGQDIYQLTVVDRSATQVREEGN